MHTEITMFDCAAAYRWLGIFCLQSAHYGESLDSNIDWLLESGLGYIWKCFCLCLHFFVLWRVSCSSVELGCLTQHLGARHCDRLSAALVSHYCQEKSTSGNISRY